MTSDLRQGIRGARVLIDFTRPEGTMAHLAVCRELGVAAVIGTTGLSAQHKQDIAQIAQQIPIVMAPNMSYSETVALAKEYEEEQLLRAMQSDIIGQLMRRLAHVKGVTG